MQSVVGNLTVRRLLKALGFDVQTDDDLQSTVVPTLDRSGDTDPVGGKVWDVAQKWRTAFSASSTTSIALLDFEALVKDATGALIALGGSGETYDEVIFRLYVTIVCNIDDTGGDEWSAVDYCVSGTRESDVLTLEGEDVPLMPHGLALTYVLSASGTPNNLLVEVTTGASQDGFAVVHVSGEIIEKTAP